MHHTHASGDIVPVYFALAMHAYLGDKPCWTRLVVVWHQDIVWSVRELAAAHHYTKLR